MRDNIRLYLRDQKMILLLLPDLNGGKFFLNNLAYLLQKNKKKTRLLLAQCKIHKNLKKSFSKMLKKMKNKQRKLKHKVKKQFKKKEMNKQLNKESKLNKCNKQLENRLKQQQQQMQQLKKSKLQFSQKKNQIKLIFLILHSLAMKQNRLIPICRNNTPSTLTSILQMN